MKCVRSCSHCSCNWSKWRNIIGFWILGLANNYPYVIMLSAAFDIIHTVENAGESHNNNNNNSQSLPACQSVWNETTNISSYPGRAPCQKQSTSVILLADILPTFFIKLTVPYVMHFFPYWIRVLTTILFSLGSFVLVAVTTIEGVIILGVVFASIGSGFGEIVFLSLTARYHKSTVSAWASGTGAAGVGGALVYALLTTFLSPKVTLLLQLFIPILMMVAYWMILGPMDDNHSHLDDHTHSDDNHANLDDHTHSDDKHAHLDGHTHSDDKHAHLDDHTHSDDNHAHLDGHTHSDDNHAHLDDHTHSDDNHAHLDDHTHSDDNHSHLDDHTHSDDKHAHLDDHTHSDDDHAHLDDISTSRTLGQEEELRKKEDCSERNPLLLDDSINTRSSEQVWRKRMLGKDMSFLKKEEAKHWQSHVKYIPNLFQYMIPLFLVYYVEYSINQAFFELLYNRNTHIGNYCLNQHTQYRWLQVIYQIGVLISRSSVSVIYIRHFWVFSLLQVGNFVFFFLASVYLFLPSFWLTMLVVLYEGLLGGAVYVNAFYTITKQVPLLHREFSMSVASVADSTGIGMAGFTGIFIHKYICTHFVTP